MANPITLERETGLATRKGPSLRTRMRRGFWGYIFVSPWILVYAAFGLYPLLLSFYLTFFTYSFVRPEDYVFVGIGNWIQGILDPLFWKSVVQYPLQPGHLYRTHQHHRPGYRAAAVQSGVWRAHFPHDLLHAGHYLRGGADGDRRLPGQPGRSGAGQSGAPRAVKKPGILEVRPVLANAHHRGDQFLEVVWHQHGDLPGRVVCHRHAVLRSRRHRWGQRLAAVLVDHHSGPAAANFLPAGGQRDQRAANVHRGFHPGV